jgi:apolipoprotein N-acyltransferase
MTMYMWLITLQKNKHSGSGFYLWFGFCFFLVVFYWDMVRSDHLSYEVDFFKTRIRIMSA